MGVHDHPTAFITRHNTRRRTVWMLFLRYVRWYKHHGALEGANHRILLSSNNTSRRTITINENSCSFTSSSPRPPHPPYLQPSLPPSLPPASIRASLVCTAPPSSEGTAGGHILGGRGSPRRHRNPGGKEGGKEVERGRKKSERWKKVEKRGGMGREKTDVSAHYDGLADTTNTYYCSYFARLVLEYFA